MKKKKPKAGASHYTSSGLKPVTIFLEPPIHAKLKALAEREDRSLQVTARRILEEKIRSLKGQPPS